MSMILAAEGQEDLWVNAWNWGVVHELVAEAALFPDEVWIPKRSNGGGVLAPAEVATLVAFLEEHILPRLGDGARMFIDGSTSTDPDDGTVYRTEEDRWKNYSLRRDVLDAVIAFLRAARSSVSFY